MQGRPRRGALSIYHRRMVNLIYKLRRRYEGWGAITILVELEDEYGYSSSELPGIDAVNRYLKEQGFVKAKEPRSKLPSEQYRSPKKISRTLGDGCPRRTNGKGLGICGYD